MRAVKRIEKIAVKVLHIEKKREISKKDAEYLILDATEQPIQRPKKDKRNITAVRKNGIQLRPNMLLILTEKLNQFQSPMKARNMTLTYINLRKIEISFTGFLRRQIVVIRE